MPRARTLILACLAVAAALGTHAMRGHAFRHHLQTQHYEDRYYLPPPDWLITLSMGHRQALADLVWIKLLENYGQELQHRGLARHFFNYSDAVIALDPSFKRAYEWAGTVSLYRLGKVTMEDAERAGSYLEAALSRFPDDGELMWLLGAHYSYEVPPLLRDREKKRHVKRKGLEYLRGASLLGAGPPWLGLVTASSLESLGQKERAIRYLSEIYMTVEDPATKADIARRLARLKNASFLEAMNRAEMKLRRLKASQFPYLSDSLYLLVGPRPAFDGAAQLKNYFDPGLAQGP